MKTLIVGLGENKNFRSLRVPELGLKDSAFQDLPLLKNLEFLDLNGNDVTDGLVDVLVQLKNLKTLIICETLIYEEESYQRLIDNLTKLETLIIPRDENLKLTASNTGLKVLMGFNLKHKTRIPGLKELQISFR
jgi:Leucine-rich repeat (LRR) protein